MLFLVSAENHLYNWMSITIITICRHYATSLSAMLVALTRIPSTKCSAIADEESDALQVQTDQSGRGISCRYVLCRITLAECIHTQLSRMKKTSFKMCKSNW